MIFPAGTGNGIYKSILYGYDQKKMTVDSYISLLKDEPAKLMDVIEIVAKISEKIRFGNM